MTTYSFESKDGYEVDYEYDFVAGRYSFDNGDPGYPDSSELNLISVKNNGVEILDTLDGVERTRLEEEAEEDVKEKIDYPEPYEYDDDND